MRKYLFIIDPQNDFVEGGVLGVEGGKQALENIIPILDQPWEKIYVTLDTHHPTNLGFTPPKSRLLKKLTEGVKLDSWPPHCIKDTWGWEIYEPLMNALEKKDNVVFLIKGEEDDKECYSAFTFGNGDLNSGNIYTLLAELGTEGGEAYYTGLAEDYCVHDTIHSLMSLETRLGRTVFTEHILLKDMTASIRSKEVVEDIYKKLPKTLKYE